MKIITSFPTSHVQPAVVTIGNFDGCHRGHQYLFKHCLPYRQHQKIVITFNNSSDNCGLLLNPQQKFAALAKHGFDLCIVQELDAKFASVTHPEFLQHYLLERLHAKVIISGEDFCFGYQRLGNADYLRHAQVNMSDSFEFIAVALLLTGNKMKISSSNIRNLLRAGDICNANAMLGYPYTLHGVVVQGEQRGRTINTPTLNLTVDRRCIVPKSGVYVGVATIAANTYTCVVNIGTRPTFAATPTPHKPMALSPTPVAATTQVIEAHVIDKKLPKLYGCEVELQFHQRLRAEKKFPSVQSLQRQIQQDIQAARQYEH
ncbi:MAG: riboflavin biosynthesis protein RibF [Pseudomonadota bacterium]|nr:riboflavin biosynthesis protein RibF [Pseudomonadota bacterium]